MPTGYQSAEKSLWEIVLALRGTITTSGSATGQTQRSALQSLAAAEVFDDIQSTFTSPTITIGDLFGHFTLFLNIDSTLAPTDIRFIVEFSNDGGTTWYEYRQGVFASLFYEDVDTASGLLVAFSGDNAGAEFRLRIVAVGTDVTNLFTVTADVEFFTSP